MTKLEDKLLAIKCNDRKEEYNLYYPLSTYGNNEKRIRDVERISVKIPEKPKMSKFSLLPVMNPKLVQNGYLKNNETFKVVGNRLYLTIYVPQVEVDKIIRVQKRYKAIVEEVKKALYLYFDNKVREEENMSRRFKYTNKELEDMFHSKEDIDEQLEEFLKSFDAFEVIGLNDTPNIVELTNLNGYKEGKYLMLGVQFCAFDKSKESTDIKKAIKKEVAKKSIENAGRDYKA